MASPSLSKTDGVDRALLRARRVYTDAERLRDCTGTLKARAECVQIENRMSKKKRRQKPDLKISSAQLAKISSLSKLVPEDTYLKIARRYGKFSDLKCSAANRFIKELLRATGQTPQTNQPKPLKTKPQKKIDYYTYIQSAKWETKKAAFRSSPYCKNKCYVCGSSKELDIHHDSYESLGHEKLQHLLELCRDHHEELHRRVNTSVYKQIKGSAELMRKEFFKKESL